MLVMLFSIGMHSTANACTPKLEIDMPEIPDVELSDSTKDMISACLLYTSMV